MGRGKIVIQRIENTSNRQVTYTKRRNGIIKKAKEITVLCDAQVSLVIFASSGKMNEFCSPATSVVDILDRYQKQSGKKLWDAKHENLSNEIDRIKKENDSMQIELRHLKGHDISSLNYKDLMAIEEALETGLANIRDQQSELARTVRRNTKLAEEENRELVYILQKLGVEGEENNMNKDMETSSDYDLHQAAAHQHQMPNFAFRVQPMQPNLQDRI